MISTEKDERCFCTLDKDRGIILPQEGKLDDKVSSKILSYDGNQKSDEKFKPSANDKNQVNTSLPKSCSSIPDQTQKLLSKETNSQEEDGKEEVRKFQEKCLRAEVKEVCQKPEQVGFLPGSVVPTNSPRFIGYLKSLVAEAWHKIADPLLENTPFAEYGHGLEQVVFIRWAICIPYNDPKEEIPACVVVTSEKLCIFHIEKLPDGDLSIPSLDSLYVVLLENVQCFVVGPCRLYVRVEQAFQEEDGTFTVLFCDSEGTDEFLEGFESAYNLKMQVTELPAMPDVVSHPDTAEQELKVVLNAFEEFASSDMVDLVIYCYGRVRALYLYAGVDSAIGIAITSSTLYIVQEDFVHWPTPLSFTGKESKVNQFQVMHAYGIPAILQVEKFDHRFSSFFLYGLRINVLSFESKPKTVELYLHQEELRDAIVIEILKYQNQNDVQRVSKDEGRSHRLLRLVKQQRLASLSSSTSQEEQTEPENQKPEKMEGNSNEELYPVYPAPQQIHSISDEGGNANSGNVREHRSDSNIEPKVYLAQEQEKHGSCSVQILCRAATVDMPNMSCIEVQDAEENQKDIVSFSRQDQCSVPAEGELDQEVGRSNTNSDQLISVKETHSKKSVLFVADADLLKPPKSPLGLTLSLNYPSEQLLNHLNSCMETVDNLPDLPPEMCHLPLLTSREFIRYFHEVTESDSKEEVKHLLWMHIAFYTNAELLEHPSCSVLTNRGIYFLFPNRDDPDSENTNDWYVDTWTHTQDGLVIKFLMFRQVKQVHVGLLELKFRLTGTTADSTVACISRNAIYTQTFLDKLSMCLSGLLPTPSPDTPGSGASSECDIYTAFMHAGNRLSTDFTHPSKVRIIIIFVIILLMNGSMQQ